MLLSTGNLVRISLFQPGDVSHLHQLTDLVGVIRRPFAEGDVLRDGLVGEQGVVLKNQTAIPFLRRDKPGWRIERGAIEHDLARIWNLQPGDDAEQRGFAAAAAADERDDLPLSAFKTDPVDCRRVGRSVAFGYGLQGQEIHCLGTRIF